jgi:DNA (cytosine-5)-methyltransferase 1
MAISNRTPHLIQRRLSAHRGARRLWLEGKRLTDVGFRAGVRYQVATTSDAIVLRLSPAGDHKVSHKQGRPVVDLLTRSLGDVERIEVAFTPRQVLVRVHPLDLAARDRLDRLNTRLAAGEQLRLGSICHGGGVASDALLRGLGSTQLAFAVEQNAAYIEQSLDHGPLSHGGMSIEADLGDIDPAILPEVDVLEAGLPCVAASRAGRSKKHLDRPEEDAQVADLAAAFCEIVRATRPAVVLLENVPEFADSASADLIRRRLGRWGYEIHEVDLDGSAWSLEARNRWVLVAVTRGLDLDLGALVPSRDHAALGEVLDRRVAADRWHTFAHLDRKEARDQARGNKFSQRVLTPTATSVPTLRRGYQKGGSTDPRLAHPTRAGYSRLLTPAEHARIKGISPALVDGLSDTVAHQVLGQSVIAPAFVGLGQLVRQAVAA